MFFKWKITFKLVNSVGHIVNFEVKAISHYNFEFCVFTFIILIQIL